MVTDVNEAPEFADEPATRSVAENTVASVNIGDDPVAAMDEDDGDTLTYTLGGTDAASFDIESTTTGGQLQTLAALDYETQTDYEVMVIATDDGVPPLTGTITVTIKVTDVSSCWRHSSSEQCTMRLTMVRAPPAKWMRTQWHQRETSVIR